MTIVNVKVVRFCPSIYFDDRIEGQNLTRPSRSKDKTVSVPFSHQTTCPSETTCSSKKVIHHLFVFRMLKRPVRPEVGGVEYTQHLLGSKIFGNLPEIYLGLLLTGRDVPMTTTF